MATTVDVAVDDAAIVKAELELEEESYVVDNRELRSSGRGIKFRLSPALGDVDDRPGLGLAKFGDVVQGVPFPDGWLMVDRKRFLPRWLKGAAVLLRLGPDGRPLAAVDGGGGRPAARPHGPEKDAAGGGAAQPSRCPGGGQGLPPVATPAQRQPSVDTPSGKPPAGPGIYEHRLADKVAETASKHEAQPKLRDVQGKPREAPAPGSGALLYRVVQSSVPVYEEASLAAEEVGRQARGDVVEVVAYDKTHLWGRVWIGADPNTGQDALLGWMPLEHELYGQMLAPV